MPRDPRKHQKNKERKNRREKEKKKLSATVELLDSYSMLNKTENQPFGFCRMNAIAFDQGIGNLMVSRALPNGKYVYVTFLVDLFCLGIKGIACDWGSAFAIDALSRKMYQDGGYISFTPEEAKKLCDGAEAHAAKFGFNPDPDYADGKQISLLWPGTIII